MAINKSDLAITKPHELEPYPFGLLSVASVNEYSENDDNWARYSAHEYNSKAFRATLLSMRDATTYTLHDSTNPSNPRFLEYLPFGIEVEDIASSFSLLAQDRFQRTLDILDAVTCKSIERELWSGDSAKYGTGGVGGAYTAGTVAATYASNVISIAITGGTQAIKAGDFINVTGLTYTGATGAVSGPFAVTSALGAGTITFAAPTGTTAIVGGSSVVVTAANANNYLTKPNAATDLTITAAGDNPRLALSLLEKSLSDAPIGERGIIHMTRRTASTLTGVGLLQRVDFSARLDRDDVNKKGQALVTMLGTPVIVGSGYSGDGPAHLATAPVTATKEWMFATGYVDVHLGASSVINEDLARSFVPNTNDVHIRAARTAAVHFEPSCHTAVRVDLSTINNF